MTPRAGRLPWAAVLLVGASIGAGWLSARGGVERLGRGPAAAVAALLLLSAFVDVLRHRRRAWRCPRCRWHGPARLLPSGPMHLGVAVPTYNNAGSIEAVVRGCVQAAPDVPLWIIDDGSTDGTGERAAAALAAAPPPPPGVERGVVRHPHNRGKGAAIVTALHQALGHGLSHLLTLDGDGQHDPRDIPAVRQASAAHPAAIVVGSRDLSDANVEPISRFGRAFSNFWLRVQTGVRLADSQSGFRVYPTAPVLSLGLRARRYDFEVEVLTVGARAGVPLRSLPIRVHYPPPAERVSHFDKLRDNARISWVNTRLLAFAWLWALGWPFALDGGAPPTNVVRDWRGRSLGGIGHAIFFAILRSVGPTPAYLLLWPVVFYYVLTQRRTLASVEPAMQALLGRAQGLDGLRRQYAHVYSFARSLLERAVVQVLGPEAFRFESEGVEHLQAAAASGRGAILLTAHVGNYPLAGAILAARRGRGMKVSVVMLDNEAEAVKRAYASAGAVDRMPSIIAVNRDAFPTLRILKALRDGELVAVGGDRVTDDNWAPAEFLGQPAPFPTGVYLMAAAARVPVVAAFGFAEGRGRYRFFAEPPRQITLPPDAAGRQQALGEHAQWYARTLESYVRRYPLQWFNFYDFWAMPAAPATPAAPQALAD